MTPCSKEKTQGLVTKTLLYCPEGTVSGDNLRLVPAIPLRGERLRSDFGWEVGSIYFSGSGTLAVAVPFGCGNSL